MAVVREFTLPDLGEGLTEATIVHWMVEVGEVVAIDQPVVEVETAKALVEVPCPYGGVVTARFGEEGAEVPVGAPLVTVAVGAVPDDLEAGGPATDSGEAGPTASGSATSTSDGARTRAWRGRDGRRHRRTQGRRTRGRRIPDPAMCSSDTARVPPRRGGGASGRGRAAALRRAGRGPPGREARHGMRRSAPPLGDSCRNRGYHCRCVGGCRRLPGDRDRTRAGTAGSAGADGAAESVSPEAEAFREPCRGRHLASGAADGAGARSGFARGDGNRAGGPDSPYGCRACDPWPGARGRCRRNGCRRPLWVWAPRTPSVQARSVRAPSLRTRSVRARA